MSDHYSGMNAVIDEIEENLTNEINYKELAKKLGTSDYTLQRIFCFIAENMTLTEYIRRRRMSKAAKELKMGAKVIDVALKYQYNSPISFARAFQKIYKIPPSKVKKLKIDLPVFPKLIFIKNYKSIGELEHRIVSLQDQTFYGKGTREIDCSNSAEIAQLWETCKKDGTLEYIKSTSTAFYYGACMYTDIEHIQEYGKKDKMHYYILGKEKREGFSKVVIPKANWALFKIDSKEQTDILKTIKQIFLEWLPSSGYEFVYPFYNIEIYYDTYCEYGIPIKQK